MKAIVTICNQPYAPLATYWLRRIQKTTDLPVFIIRIGDWEADLPGVAWIPTEPSTNPFPPDMPDHACAEKLRVFRYLPREVSEVLFIDVDIMVFNRFWEERHFELAHTHLLMVPDRFVGYKEKMEEEFCPFDPSFRMKFLPSGEYSYFNTGVFFASRSAHESHFEECLKVWRSYVSTTGRLPSIFDQNLFNYYLISRNLAVLPLPLQNNCLRQYSHVVHNGRLFLDDLPVDAFHLNGGEVEVKLIRWEDMERMLGGSV